MTVDVQWQAPSTEPQSPTEPAAVEVLGPDEWTPQEAAARINAKWRNMVEGIVETGEVLIEAKRRVRHGDWAQVVSDLQFGDRTARSLMQIARHPDLANRHHAADLPASWTTLAVLSQLPPGVVAARIEAGEITPKLERATAQVWANEYEVAQQLSHNAYYEASDHLRKALSWAQGYPPPANLPASRTQPEEFAEWAATLYAKTREWTINT